MADLVDPRWLTFAVAVLVLIFQMGRYFGVDKALNEWRQDVNDKLRFVNGLAEWRRRVEETLNRIDTTVQTHHADHKASLERVRSEAQHQLEMTEHRLREEYKS